MGPRLWVPFVVAILLGSESVGGCGGGPGGDADAEAGLDAEADAESPADADSGRDGDRDDEGDRDADGDAGPDADRPPSCALSDSGPIEVTVDGTVVEGLRITSTDGPAVRVTGASDVVIRRCEIRHRGGEGIRFARADRIRIEDVAIVHEGAPASGPNPSAELNNIAGELSAGVVVTRARLTRGSSGVYLLECPGAALSWLEGHDFRGPLPRGQLVQLNRCDGAVLEDFSVVNPPGSWPEDNVNVYRSAGVTVRRGHVDGNNSPSGVGVIFDGGDATGLVEDVDAIRMANGCFSAYAGGDGSVFRRTRCRENVCEGRDGRGEPSSGGLMWAGQPGLSALRIEASAWYAACAPDNVVWPRDSFEVIDLVERDFAMREPVVLELCWQ